MPKSYAFPPIEKRGESCLAGCKDTRDGGTLVEKSGRGASASVEEVRKEAGRGFGGSRRALRLFAHRTWLH
jgi:hypothetical protein